MDNCSHEIENNFEHIEIYNNPLSQKEAKL